MKIQKLKFARNICSNNSVTTHSLLIKYFLIVIFAFFSYLSFCNFPSCSVVMSDLLLCDIIEDVIEDRG